MKVLVVLLAVMAVVMGEERKSYRGHQLLSVRAENQEQLDLLNELYNTNDDVNMVFLKFPSRVLPTEIVVPPEHLVAITKKLKSVGLKISLEVADMQLEIDEFFAENDRAARMAVNETVGQYYSPSHTSYHNYDSVNTILLNFANAYPSVAKRVLLGKRSEEGRNVYSLEVGTSGSNKPVIIVESLAHAREWITTASTLYVIDQLLKGYASGEAQAKAAVEKYLWIFVPITNPDGYVYSWTTNRLWRKNRKRLSSSCYGVDLNRNFDIQFGGVGTSPSCSSDTYPGTFAFSESESQNIADLVNTHRANLKSYLSVHSYSQLLLKPWGYETSANRVPPNIAELNRVGALVNSALSSNGKTYTFGTAYAALGYAASGAAEDWALTAVPGIYAYCYELRPRTAGEGGFDIPASQIVPTGVEYHRSLLVLSQQIR